MIILGGSGKMECGHICAVTHRDIKEANTDYVSWTVWLPQLTASYIKAMTKT